MVSERHYQLLIEELSKEVGRLTVENKSLRVQIYERELDDKEKEKETEGTL